MATCCRRGGRPAPPRARSASAGGSVSRALPGVEGELLRVRVRDTLPSCHAPATDSEYSQLTVHEERVVGQRACAENKLARLWARSGLFPSQSVRQAAQRCGQPRPYQPAGPHGPATQAYSWRGHTGRTAWAQWPPIPRQAGVWVEHPLRFSTEWRAVALDHVVEEAEERVALHQRAALVAQPHARVGAQPGGQRADSAPVSTSKVGAWAGQSRRPGGRSAEATRGVLWCAESRGLRSLSWQGALRALLQA